MASGSGSGGAEAPIENVTLHADDEFIRRASVAVHGFAEIQSDAQEATRKEHNMTLKEALRLYPKAVGWSILLSTAIIMEGYDVVLLSSFYALPQFNQKYGVIADDGAYTIPAPWKSGLSNGALCGEILGLFATGVISEKYGYRKTMIGALNTGSSYVSVIDGLRGAFQTLTTAYASEVCPVALRAYLCTYVNLCWVMGQFIASGVVRALLSREDQWAYRIPFAIQWMWPIPILIGCIFAPESPWWLVRKGRIEEAKAQLLRLTTRGDHTFDADNTIAMMQHTDELEKSVSEGTSYLDCFRGCDLRRTEIVCLTWVVQALCGSTFIGENVVAVPEDVGEKDAGAHPFATIGEFKKLTSRAR
ncbi:putative General alpha-glucoside permease [Glarea lozoyensis 74030]|uniref:Putative General alpha-glucoside permease n=1 Tax=Glarea lozoyensis (strain ATCC 74030 / MF5533) TaxID=1104152 RepID=H0ENV1_GLAL7|nr:putative General alpha-glucoside permease [Glarea lozoyensis 74030]